MPVEEAYRIRTGESGEETLQAHPDAAVEVAGDGPRGHASGIDGAASAAPSRIEPPARRLRAVHLQMVDAVLGGRRPRARWPSWPRRPPARPSPSSCRGWASRSLAGRQADLGALRRYVGERCRGRPVAGAARRRRRGADRHRRRAARRRAAARRRRPPAPEAGEFLQIAAVAALTEVADRRRRRAEVERTVRDSFLEELRARRPAGRRRDRAPRGARSGCDLRRGAVALCAELTTERPRHVARHALRRARRRAGPAARGRARVRAAARRRRRRPGGGRRSRRAAVAERLRRHGAVGRLELLRRARATSAARSRRPSWCSTCCAAATCRSARTSARAPTGCCSACFASHPDEVRSFYEDTVAPLVRYDEQYGSDLVADARDLPRAQLRDGRRRGGDLRAPPHDRLPARAREGADRAWTPRRPRTASASGSGLKAYRIVAPRLPR